MKYKIPFIKPSFPSGKEIAEDFEKIVLSNWFTNFGPFENELRQKVATYLDQSVHVTTVSNATLGIDLAVRALLELSPGKNKVIVPSFTFAAGPEVLISHGYEPVFIDIVENTWQPDIEQAREYIQEDPGQVAGILLCNIFGVGNQMIEQWEMLARQYGVPLIVDSAAGFGSKYDNNTFIGGRGDCEIFSLHATKPFAVGEGGLIVSKSDTLIEKIRSLENFGFNKDRKIGLVGTNAKLQELNCAIGIRQLANLKSRIETRQVTLDYYKSKLGALGYRFQSNDSLSTVAFVSALVPEELDVNRLIGSLSKEGVEVKQYYRPLHHEKVILGESSIAKTLDNTEYIASKIISLPLHDDMEKKDIDYIVEICKRVVFKNEQKTKS